MAIDFGKLEIPESKGNGWLNGFERSMNMDKLRADTGKVNLESQQMRETMPYLAPQEREKLQEAIYKNLQSKAEQPTWGRMAEAKLATEQSIAPNRNAQTRGFDLANKASEIKMPYVEQRERAEIGELGSRHTSDIMKQKMLQDMYARSQQNPQGQSPNGTGGANGANGANSGAYGIQTPSLDRNDFTSIALGGNPIQIKQQAYQKNVEAEKAQYEKKLNNYSTELQGSRDFKDLLNQYNYHMDQGNLTGGFSFIPGSSKLPESQAANSALAKMQLGAVQQLKAAMGEGKFSNLDMQKAAETKPQINWSHKTRKNYTKWIDAVDKRLQERQQFYNAASDPSLGISNKDADLAWQNYQQNFPLTDEKGDKALTENLGHWKDYLRPSAISSIKNEGNYKPRTELSKGEKILARTIELPKFPGGAVEFKKWFDRQPPMAQKAVRAHLEWKEKK